MSFVTLPIDPVNKSVNFFLSILICSVYNTHIDMTHTRTPISRLIVYRKCIYSTIFTICCVPRPANNVIFSPARLVVARAENDTHTDFMRK